MYGYITNTKIKFIVVLKDVVGDPNLKSWFRDLHSLFIATMANPFASLNSKIESSNFDAEIAKLAQSYDKKSIKVS